VPEQFGGTWHPAANPAGLTELEVASGIVLGPGNGPRLALDARVPPVQVLRDRACSLLAEHPCVVAFSGGRDSSALLAVLVDVARREGLDEPVAVTARWDDDEQSDESAWQEQVIATIGVQNWQIIRPGTDLDLLGAEATTALEHQGLMWPAPSYALLPMIRTASGGVFLTGEGGDEAFGLWPYGRLWSTVGKRKIPRQSDLRALLLGCAPRAARRRWWRHKLPPYQTWLRPGALARTAELMADDQADDPLSWGHYQIVNGRRRSADLFLATLSQLCASEGSNFVAPFLDTTFLAALGAWGGPLGKGDRTDVMTTLFSDVLPGPILSRTSKATFGGVFWGPASRAFAEAWDGTGLDSELIDAEALRQAWMAPVPVYGSALPLHAAWLFDHQRHREIPQGP